MAIDPDFTSNRLVYLSYSEPGEGGASTAVARGKLGDNGLDDVEVDLPPGAEGSMAASISARVLPLRLTAPCSSPLASASSSILRRTSSNDLGKIVRINPDGSIPKDNPFVGRKDARPEIWSYGHRNPQGAAIHPETGKLWETEFGPRGGDELNIPKAGSNYGWPVVSWGSHYDGQRHPRPADPSGICRRHLSLEPGDLALRHRPSIPPTPFPPGRATSSLPGCRRRRSCASPSTARRSRRRSEFPWAPASATSGRPRRLGLRLDRRGGRQDPAAYARKFAQMTRQS